MKNLSTLTSEEIDAIYAELDAMPAIPPIISWTVQSLGDGPIGSLYKDILRERDAIMWSALGRKIKAATIPVHTPDGTLIGHQVVNASAWR